MTASGRGRPPGRGRCCRFERFSRLRMESRLALLQGRVHLAGALSGRDINAANKTMSGLLKLPSPSAEELEIPAEYLEWAVRLGLEVRRRAKEPQKRIGHARRSLHAKAT